MTRARMRDATREFANSDVTRFSGTRKHETWLHRIRDIAQQRKITRVRGVVIRTICDDRRVAGVMGGFTRIRGDFGVHNVGNLRGRWRVVSTIIDNNRVHVHHVCC